MNKSPDAFRTISEVSDWLDTPAHVLRFWESKFTQIKPVKRAGGRRYYRPEDMALLAGIKSLLHEQGMTIKGVQKLLREKGVRHVAGLGPDGDGVATHEAPVPQTTDPQPVAAVVTDRATHATATGVNRVQADPPAAEPAALVPDAAPAPIMPGPKPQPAPVSDPPMHAARPPHLPPIAMPPDRAHRPPVMPPATSPTPADQPAPPAMQPRSPGAQRPLPTLPVDRPAAPGLLAQIARMQPATIAARRVRLVPVLHRLAVLRDRMAGDQA